MPLTLLTTCSGDTLDLTVEVGLVVSGSSSGVWNAGTWDVSLWGYSETFTDVSAYVEGLSVNRSFSRDLRIWSAGTIQVRLCNQDGRFSPDNLTGPYVSAGVSSIKPGCAIRAYVTWKGTTYHIFRGFVTEWAEQWEGVHGASTGGANTVVSGTDEWARIAKAPGVVGGGTVGSGEKMRPRLIRILTASGSGAPTSFDLGYATLQATDLSSDPAQEIEVTLDSEGGAFVVDTDGTLLALDKYSLVEDTRSVTTQVTFSDSGVPGTVPWQGIDVAPLNDTNLINNATYMIVGGTEQRYFDPASVAQYGQRADQSPNATRLVADSDAQAYSLAQWVVSSRKDPEAEVRAITISVGCDPDTLVPLVFGLRLRDLVRVERTPPSSTGFTMTRDCFISGISLDISEGDQRVTFALASATAYVVFADSRWDIGLWDVASWFP